MTDLVDFIYAGPETLIPTRFREDCFESTPISNPATPPNPGRQNAGTVTSQNQDKNVESINQLNASTSQS